MDQIIEKVGTFGLFQATLFTITTCCHTVAVWGMLFMIFGNYNPGWSCSNNTLTQDTGGSAPSGLDVETLNATAELDVTGCKLWKECERVVYDPSSSTAVTEWNLICDHSWVLSVIITIQMCGVLVGSYIAGPIGDRLGRKVSLLSGVSLIGIASLIAAFSVSWQMFAVLRFFIGFGVGMVLSSAFIFPLEFVGGWWRPVLASVPIWSLGSISFVAATYGLKSWRDVHFLAAGLAVVSVVPGLWIPESMRWLAVTGKVREFESVVRRMASWNRRPPVDQEFLDEKIREIIEVQRDEPNPSYLDLFRTRRLRSYSIKFGLIWVFMAFVYYTISFGIKSFSGDFYINMILFALSETPGMFLIAPLANRFGRRFAANFFYGFTALFCFIVAVLELVPGQHNAVISVAMANLSKLSIVGAWGAIFVVSNELYPTVVRNLHSGYLNALSRFGSILASYMVPGEDNLYISYIVMGVVLLVCFGLTASVAESRGKPMADVIKEGSAKGSDDTAMHLKSAVVDDEQEEDEKEKVDEEDEKDKIRQHP